MATIIQIRRDSLSNWSATNPVLALGEKGIVIDDIGSDNVRYKWGDGVSKWNDLPFNANGSGGRRRHG